jgi:hypothetical protein
MAPLRSHIPVPVKHKEIKKSKWRNPRNTKTESEDQETNQIKLPVHSNQEEYKIYRYFSIRNLPIPVPTGTAKDLSVLTKWQIKHQNSFFHRRLTWTFMDTSESTSTVAPDPQKRTAHQGSGSATRVSQARHWQVWRYLSKKTVKDKN